MKINKELKNTFTYKVFRVIGFLFSTGLMLLLIALIALGILKVIRLF